MIFITAKYTKKRKWFFVWFFERQKFQFKQQVDGISTLVEFLLHFAFIHSIITDWWNGRLLAIKRNENWMLKTLLTLDLDALTHLLSKQNCITYTTEISIFEKKLRWSEIESVENVNPIHVYLTEDEIFWILLAIYERTCCYRNWFIVNWRELVIVSAMHMNSSN